MIVCLLVIVNKGKKIYIYILLNNILNARCESNEICSKKARPVKEKLEMVHLYNIICVLLFPIIILHYMI